MSSTSDFIDAMRHAGKAGVVTLSELGELLPRRGLSSQPAEQLRDLIRVEVTRQLGRVERRGP